MGSSSARKEHRVKNRSLFKAHNELPVTRLQNFFLKKAKLPVIAQ